MRRNYWPLCYCIALCLFLQVSLIHAAEEDFCGVVLSVVDPFGQKVSDAKAQLIGPSGKVEQIEIVVDGRARFCDFGFGKHSILVEANPCAAVTLRNIELRYEIPQTLAVVLNQCQWQGDIVSNGCSTYVRVSAHDGSKVGGVAIDSSLYGNWGTTDRFGRAKLFLPFGKEQDFIFTREGFEPGHLHLTCSHRGVGTSPETSVVLIDKK